MKPLLDLCVWSLREGHGYEAADRTKFDTRTYLVNKRAYMLQVGEKISRDVAEAF